MGKLLPFRKTKKRTTAPPEDLCLHKNIPLPAFDEAAAVGLDEWEVRKRWPRGNGRCPNCGSLVITYASSAHYAAGDW